LKRCIVVILVLVTLLPLAISCSRPAPSPGAAPQKPKAGIIDQISVTENDTGFDAKASAILTSAGFAVDVWKGTDVTVDFYRQLPQLGYRLIILRVHSGLLLSIKDSKITASDTTYLFTGETYSTKKHVSEQLTNRVSNALMTDTYPLVFAINSQFITDDMNGSFNKAAVIAMGCESYKLDDLANAFIKKGASLFVGWSSVVSLDYVDGTTLDLLDNLCAKNMPVTESMASTMDRAGADPYFGTFLKAYPAQAENQTLQKLIG
jgi:hypothetical protein